MCCGHPRGIASLPNGVPTSNNHSISGAGVLHHAPFSFHAVAFCGQTFANYRCWVCWLVVWRGNGRFKWLMVNVCFGGGCWETAVFPVDCWLLENGRLQMVNGEL